MTTIPFFDRLDDSPSFHTLVRTVPDAGQAIHVHGLAGSLKGLFAAHLLREQRRQIVYVAIDADAALDAWNDVTLAVAEQDALFLGERHDTRFRSLDSNHAENADILRHLAEHSRRVVVTDCETLFDLFPGMDVIRQSSIQVERRMTLRQEHVIRELSYGGFERNEYVVSVGEFAVRGGIIDVFPAGFENPLRIEFFGDEVDSIREFDVMSQRSIRTLDSVGFLATLFFDDTTDADALRPMTDFFQSDAIVIIEERELLMQTAHRLGHDSTAAALLSRPLFDLSTVLTPGASVRHVDAAPQPSLNSSVKLLMEELHELSARHLDVLIVADSEQQATRMRDILGSEDEYGLERFPGNLSIMHCPLSQGFILHDLRLAVYTEHQVFSRRRIQKRVSKGAKGLSLRELRQLHPGDYVVHVDKGIGKFEGFDTIRVAGGLQEMAKIRYADDDMLYVNLNYINRLQKYASEEGAAPRLSKLGTGEWDRLRARAKKRLKDIARDLIALYARRKASQGYAFPPDAQWQKEMEASFMYEDTPDQYKATVDVKRDMEEATPMDRLVCGDVGYGKTEVAVRAAFKAVLGNKQVAILVPTTILAQQHFNTFHDRLHRYSVGIEALSRFKTTAEQKETVRKLKEGAIDIVIGTHRILSKDIQFKDLGLLIIDEEHRFGVAAKEKLRQLRVNVDTMTMTATPIPRTLNFCLLGARDLSVIETPPRNRLPIATTIVQFDGELLREAIVRELDRGGQVYMVNDKIAELDKIADKLRRLVPSIRIGMAHGQMTATELERVMMRFLEKKIDILVTTKIIESGLDIPNVNTIFIHNAHRFGLAELYQLRGRVGRSNIQAYAYLLIPPALKLTRDALKRLQALEEFSELGAGFQLAMRDLEIRGAGNLLGAEQSGFIADIGLELYVSTVEEAVHELKTEEFQDLFSGEALESPRPAAPMSVVIELGMDAYLPQSYVANSTERFELYKRMYNIANDEQLRAIEEELFDRFGLYPPETENLLFVIRVRMASLPLRVARVGWDAPKLSLTLPAEEDEVFYPAIFQRMALWIFEHKDVASFEQEGKQLRMALAGVATKEMVLDRLAELAAYCIPTDASGAVSGDSLPAT
jgi:transcription-repair coupling factor (superfamily II helicase)